MIVHTSQLQMLANYALVLPDPQLETYQLKGNETGLISPDFKYEKGEKITVREKNMSVFGTVYGVPTSLNFNMDEIERIKRSYTLQERVNGQIIPVNISIHRQIGELTRNSVLFDTEIEIKKGDRVNFSYQAHKKAKDERMILDTELGEMYLIKYDMLFMTVDEHYKPIKMLNGYILTEPEELEVKKEGAQEFIEHTGGLVTLAPKYKIKKTRKTQVGKVIKAGRRNNAYLQFPDKRDCIESISEGQQILYDPRLCQKVEYESHQIMSDKILHLVHRKDISYVSDEKFDLSKIELGRKKNV